jgi:hypothetical protein
VPWDFKREKADVTFPAGTADFFRQLQVGLQDVKVEIASDEDTYYEVDLHSDVLRYTKVVVKQGLLPLFLGVLGSVIADELRKPRPINTVEISIVVDSEDGKCIQVDYKGSPGDVEKTISDFVTRCLPQKNADTPNANSHHQQVPVISSSGADLVNPPTPPKRKPKTKPVALPPDE